RRAAACPTSRRTRPLVQEPSGFRTLLQHGLEHRDVREVQDRPAVAADLAVHPGLERKAIRLGNRLVAAAGAARGERNVPAHLLAPCPGPSPRLSQQRARYTTAPPAVCRGPLLRMSTS